MHSSLLLLIPPSGGGGSTPLDLGSSTSIGVGVLSLSALQLLLAIAAASNNNSLQSATLQQLLQITGDITGVTNLSLSSLSQVLGILGGMLGQSSSSSVLSQKAFLTGALIGSGLLGSTLRQLVQLSSASYGSSQITVSSVSQKLPLTSNFAGSSVELSSLFQLLSMIASHTGSSFSTSALLQKVLIVAQVIASGQTSAALSQTLSLVSEIVGSSQFEASTLVFGFFLYAASTGSSTLNVNSLYQSLSLVSHEEGVGNLASAIQNLFFITSSATGEAVLSSTAKFVLSMLATVEGTSALVGTLFQGAHLNGDVVAAALMGAALAQSTNLSSGLVGTSLQNTNSFYQLLGLLSSLKGEAVESASYLRQLAKLNSGSTGYSVLSSNVTLGALLQLLANATGSSNLLVTKLGQAFLLGQTEATGISFSVASLAQSLALASSSNGSATLQGLLEKMLELASSSTGSSRVEVTLELLSSILTNFPVYYVVSLPNNEVWIITADPYKDRVADAPKNIPNVVSFIQ